LCTSQFQLAHANDIDFADDYATAPGQYLIHVERTIVELEAQEDTDGNFQITVEDLGPKVRYVFGYIALSY
jgi:hypothetical protein